jgi:uncharacterized protein (DUF305 family)
MVRVKDASTTTEPDVGGPAAPADVGGPADPATPVAPADDPGNGLLGPGDDEGGDGGDDEGPVGGLSWGRVVVLVAAVAFLGFAVGMFVSRDRPPGEGSVDVGFYRDMIAHHEQALSLATLHLANGENATVRSYAREVLTFQSYEIGVMLQTLSDWGYSSEQSGEAMVWMDMPEAADQMPGYLSADQIDAMNDARGREADSMFLDLMAEHHRGGLHMAEYAAGHADDSGVREMAARMAHNQAQEINEYRETARRLDYDITIEPSDVPPDLPS